MELKVTLSNDDVCKIIEDHVRKNVLYHFAEGKEVSVSSDSYSGLGAKVSITEKEKDDE